MPQVNGLIEKTGMKDSYYDTGNRACIPALTAQSNSPYAPRHGDRGLSNGLLDVVQPGQNDSPQFAESFDDDGIQGSTSQRFRQRVTASFAHDRPAIRNLPHQLVENVLEVFVDDGVGVGWDKASPNGRHRSLDLDVGVVEVSVQFRDNRLFVRKKLLTSFGRDLGVTPL